MAGYRTPGPTCSTTSEPIDAGTSCRASSPLPVPVGVNAPSLASAISGEDGDGVAIVLTPIQLAAIFGNESVEQPGSLKERLWGGATLIGGALELVGAAVLLAMPEPTTTTKIAGGVLGVHGLDTAAAGARQVASGQSTTTFTAEAAQSAATALGVDDKRAALIGLTVDLGIPLILGLAGAARVLAIRRGAVSLAAEEAAGGHTIARHVGRTEVQLRLRLAAESRLSVASSFRTLADAEKYIAEALRAQQAEIKAWAKIATAGQTKAIAYDAGRAVGFGVVRATNSVEQMTRLAIVIRKVQQGDRIYFILTAYPKL
jgi:hypothetical protein